MMMLIIFMVFLPFLLIFFLKYFSIGVSHDQSQLPPGPYTWKILRNISLFKNSPHIAFNNLAKIYGPLFSIRIGGQLVVVASSQTTAKEILKNRTTSGRFLPSLYYSIPGTTHLSVVSAKECDDMWKSLRTIGQSYIFSSKAIEANTLIRKNKVMEMMNYLRTKEGESLNIENVIFATISNIVANILASRNLFSINLDGIADRKLVALIHEIVGKANSPGLGDLFSIFKRIDFWSKRSAMDMYRLIKFAWGDIIKERRASIRHDSEQDFFDVLAQNAYSDDQIASLLMEFLTAGTHTTTMTTVMLMIKLMKNQEILFRVRDEISNQALDGNSINESRLSECQYFQACIKEILRLHIPGAFGVPHRAIETCKVNNYTIPKDTIILVNFWAIHLDPNNWEDPESFKPERFLGSNIDFMGAHFQFLPFSAGQRMCPAANVAVKNVQLIVAYLVYYFDWNFPDDVNQSNLDEIMGKLKTTFEKENPLCLIPKIREQHIFEQCI
ncbi:hypothetical protein ACJIZ3_000049 [Penstemon smallii]|uniref:Cytochrome P450 n=1 Tax=Penstemon smallii TaxID=265156 RepID=A0ABD3RAX9_9LAMI